MLSALPIITLTCLILGDDGFILLSTRYEIRRVELNTTHSRRVISDLIDAVGLDFDFETGSIYWSDMAKDTIQRADVKNGSDVAVIIQDDLDSPEGITVDWINKKLYWTDSGTRRIEVADMNGGNRLSLVQSGLVQPRAIAVHPFIG